MVHILSLPEEILQEILFQAAFDWQDSCNGKSHINRVCYNQYRGILQTCQKFRRIGGNIYWKELNIPTISPESQASIIPRRVTKTRIPFDVKFFVTELNIGTTHSFVSRSNDGQVREDEGGCEWWGVLLNWNVLPYLHKITINGTRVSHRLNSAIASSKTCSLNDKQSLQQLDHLASTIPESHHYGGLEIHIYGIDDSVVMDMANYPSLQKCIRTLWFHDRYDDAGESCHYKLPDFGKSLANMTELRDLSITVGFPAVPNFTTFLQVLGKFPKLEKLELSYTSRPTMDDHPMSIGIEKFRPVIPESLKSLSCPSSFIDTLNLLEPFTSRTFESINDLTLYVDKRRMSLALPFHGLESLQVYILDGDNAKNYRIENLIDLTSQNTNTLRSLSVAAMNYTEVIDLVQTNPDLEELHIGRLLSASVPFWTPTISYLLDLKKLKHLTVNVSSTAQLTTGAFAKLLTRCPLQEHKEDFDDEYHYGGYEFEPSNSLETVTVKLNPYEEVRKTPPLVINVTNLPSSSYQKNTYDLSQHGVLHYVPYVKEVIPSVEDVNRIPPYLMNNNGSRSASYIVFDVKSISTDLYPDFYYSGRYLKNSSPYGSNLSSGANSDDEMGMNYSCNFALNRYFQARRYQS